MEDLKSKYFNRMQKRPFSQSEDVCAIGDWEKLSPYKLCARHGKNFLIFLKTEEVEKDEYSIRDPYEVESNLNSDFQRKRIDGTVEMLKQVLGSGESCTARILDLGCGQGHVTAKILDTFPQAEISALDNSVSAIEFAVDHFPGIDFIVADACEPPYSENYFDAIVCNNLWEHVPNPLLLLAAISRILKPSGFLLISTPSRYRISNLLRILRGRPVVLLSKMHITEYSIGQIMEQMKYGGFKITRIASSAIWPKKLTGKLVYMFFLLITKITKSHNVLDSTVLVAAKKAAFL